MALIGFAPARMHGIRIFLNGLVELLHHGLTGLGLTVLFQVAIASRTGKSGQSFR